MAAPIADPITQLALRCRESGLSQVEIARRIGVDPGALSRVLNRRRSPSVHLVGRVLAAVDCLWADLDAPGGEGGGDG